MELDILNTIQLKDIPGASGIVAVESGYFIVGDNSPFIHLTDRNFKTISEYRIFDSRHGIIPKPEKPDFEAMEQIGPDEILIFGSGSRSPERDVLIRFNPNNPADYESHTISSFYHALHRHLPKGSELNIEALAYQNDTLYLLNRHPATIFVLSYTDLLTYLINGCIPEIKTYTYTLPGIDRITTGFSGATIPQGSSSILFTASAEDTDNAYDDGQIMGSILGKIDLINGKPAENFTYFGISTENPLKIEGLCTVSTEKISRTGLILISDSDGSGSLALNCLLRI